VIVALAVPVLVHASSISTLAGRPVPVAGAPALATRVEGFVIEVMLYPEALTLPPVVESVTPLPGAASLHTVAVLDTPTGSGLIVTVTVYASPRQPVVSATGTIV
jgi:hypothetical protein